MVSGVPRIIEALAGRDAVRGSLEFSDECFDGAMGFRLLQTNERGSSHAVVIDGEEVTGWLCPVFFHYYRRAPETLYAAMKRPDD